MLQLSKYSLMTFNLNSKLLRALAAVSLVLGLVFNCNLAWAENSKQIITVNLEQRLAEDILASIQPHISWRVKVSQQGQTLILSGPKKKIQPLEELILSLDVPLQTWRVFFVQGAEDLQKRQTQQARHTARSYSTYQERLQEILVTEGSSSELTQSFWIPVEINTGQASTLAYDWLAGGIWVSISPLGEKLRLNFLSQKIEAESTATKPSKAQFSSAGMQSSLNLNLGQWLTLGSESSLAQRHYQASKRYLGGSPNEFYSVCVEIAAEPSCFR